MINIADLVNPATGNSYREDNSELVHKIPIGSIVEILPHDEDPQRDYGEHTGLRLFVVRHTRDCDQTPLYSLSYFSPAKFAEEIENLRQLRAELFRPEITGMSEDSLKLIK